MTFFIQKISIYPAKFPDDLFQTIITAQTAFHASLHSSIDH